MNTAPTTPEALIVASLAAVFVAWLYFRHRERQQRVEVVHRERLAAMEKGIPLPELPLDPPRVPRPVDPRAPLLHGIAWTAIGLGAMVALGVTQLWPHGPSLWPLGLPLLLLGLGLMLYYRLATDRAK